MLKNLFLFTSLTLLLAACGRSSVIDSPITIEQKTAANALTAPTDNCVADMTARFKQLQASQQNWYKQIKSPVPTQIHQSHLHIGTNGRAIVLIHGFLSSPAYLKDIADNFAAQGYTVVIPLLTGFGSDPNAANAATVKDWRAAIDAAFDMARPCTDSVSVIAHSLGAALVTEELEQGTLKDLDRVAVLAPYYRTYSEWTKRLVLHLPFHVDLFNIATLQAWLGPIGIHLVNFKFTPEGNGTVLPMNAVRTVLQLQDELAAFEKIHIDQHVLPIVSMDDETIDSAFALAYVKVHFKEDTPIVYAEGSKVYHSLETREDNPHFDQMMTQLTNYLNDSHH